MKVVSWSCQQAFFSADNLVWLWDLLVVIVWPLLGEKRSDFLSQWLTCKKGIPDCEVAWFHWILFFCTGAYFQRAPMRQVRDAQDHWGGWSKPDYAKHQITFKQKHTDNHSLICSPEVPVQSIWISDSIDVFIAAPTQVGRFLQEFTGSQNKNAGSRSMAQVWSKFHKNHLGCTCFTSVWGSSPRVSKVW